MCRLYSYPHTPNLIFCVVEEVRYERVLPTYNAADVKTSTEFNFVIPPSSEYFTRYRVCVCNYMF